MAGKVVLAAGLALALASCHAADSSSRATSTSGDVGGSGGSASTSSSGGGAGDPDPVFTDAEMAALRKLSPKVLPPPPTDVSNAKADDAAAAAFGQRLFFTPIFAGKLLDGDDDGGIHTLGKRGDTGRVSCAGCHVPTSDFSDTRSPSEQTSLGSGWGSRKAPSLLDVGQAKLLMWDGAHDTLYNQPFGPLESPLEMNSSRLYAAEQVFANFKDEYEAVFGPMPPLDDSARFPQLSASGTGCAPADQEAHATCDGPVHGAPGDGAEFDGLSADDQDAVTRVVVNMGKALGAYERLLACGPGKFDAWMHGDKAAMSRAAQRGAAVFVGRGKCVSCHSGPYLSDQRFHDVGLTPAQVASAFIDDNDHGASIGLAASIASPLNIRGKFSDGDDGRLPTEVAASFEGTFRTPTLRCASRRPSFMHTAQLRTLDRVISFFDQGGDLGLYPGKKEIEKLGLSDLDQSDLGAFIEALDGKGAEEHLLKPPM